jgi:hypothetical protein
MESIVGSQVICTTNKFMNLVLAVWHFMVPLMPPFQKSHPAYSDVSSNPSILPLYLFAHAGSAVSSRILASANISFQTLPYSKTSLTSLLFIAKVS